jgi:SAM-dependent methyltransferase
MTLPAPLQESSIELLRPPAGAGDVPPPARQRDRYYRKVRAAARRGARRALRRAEDAGLLRTRQAAFQANVRLDGVEHEVDRLRPVLVRQELLASEQSGVGRDLRAQRDEISALAEQVSSLTADVGALRHRLTETVEAIDALGAGIAPGEQLAAAPLRLAELRDQVNSLGRLVRQMNTAATTGLDAGRTSAFAASGVPTAAFDYLGFERRFRGDPETVVEELWHRYGARLAAAGPVADLGCGRGDLVERLVRAGTEAVGVDTDATMVQAAVTRGLNIHQADALAWLSGQPDGSLGGIIAIHLVEHLELSPLVGLLETAAAKLRPGGLFVAETPNPTSLNVLGNSYVLDPTHVRPVHPRLLAFLCERAGFRDIDLEFYAPATDEQVPLVDAADAPAWVATVNNALRRLNDTLFGAQDYAVVARVAPPATGPGSAST